jgi:PAS domain S-box-containing protein
MLAISDLWLQKLGYSREEVIGRFAPDLLTPASRQKAVDEVLPRLFSQGRVDDVAYQVQTRKGQVLDVLLSAVVERDEQGQPLHSLSVLVDVTERRQAERALAEKRDVADALQRDLSNILDAVPSMIGYWDARQLNRFANQAYYDWFGIEPGTLPGLHISEMMGPALYALNRPHIEAVLRGEEQVFEREIPHRDGSSVRHALTRYLPDLRDGDVRGFYVLSFDVSRMKATQRELQTLNETLAERTRQAEAANVAKSAFLANMSHEIRTPMNAILGMLALLQKTELTVRQADYAAKTEGAARALLGLLNDILDFSKVEAGKMTLDPQPFEVDRLLRDLSVILAANVGGKPIELLFDLDKHLPRRLVADETRLRQILINLGANAIKFTEQGSVTLSIAVLARQADEVTLEIAVRDTGIGIAPENQERIFSAFTQAEASTTRRFGGTGLGLAICQRLVAMMGGGLRLDSALGHGSRFHFQLTLPLAGADAPEAAQPAPPVGTLRALIVDDNAEAREVLLRMALSLGWQADVADSGEGALALLAEQPGGYGAVFVDWQMPGLDGWQTCRLIREQALADTAPLLVMVTAHGREMLAARSEDEQGLLSGFLVKPVTASMLQDAMAEARSAGQVAPEPRRAAPAALRRLAGLRVLLAEDNENNQQVARELLEGEGAEVVIAANGQAAVAAAAAADAAFDVVLMDLQMPVMDGYTATARLRQDPRHGRLPIIAMTANVMASDREACLAAGMDDHVGKPFDLDELVRTMRRHTGRSEDAPPTAQPPAAAAWPAAVLERARAASVDLVPAVTRMGGQASVYARMLASFLRDMPGLQARLRSAVAAADPVAAARLTHTLKGLAGTLGAQALAALASDAEAGLGLVVRSGLEGDLADADAHADAEAECARACAAVDAAIDAAFSPLSELLAGLSAVRPAAQAAGPTTVLTAAESPALLAELRQLARALADSDMGATTLMSQLADRFGGGLGVRLEPLEAAVTSLDFDTALNHCANLIEEYAA